MLTQPPGTRSGDDLPSSEIKSALSTGTPWSFTASASIPEG